MDKVKRTIDNAIKRMRVVQISFLLLVVLLFSGSATAQNEYGADTAALEARSVKSQIETIEQLKKQLNADPDNTDRQLELGRAYYQLLLETRDEAALLEAERLLAEVLQRRPDDALALAIHGSLL